MEIIQEIGAYAGLAAVVGLALLSALYFSQARDVRRLREWAGKAPERTSEAAAQAPKIAERAVPRAPGAGTTTPNVRPVPAAAGAGGAVAAATPAAARVAEAPPEEPTTDGGGQDNGVSQDTMAHPPPAAPDEDSGEEELDDDEDRSTEVDDGPFHEDHGDDDLYEDDAYDEDDDLEYDEETGDRPAVAAPVAAVPRRPVPPAPLTAAGARPGATTTSGGSILPPYQRSRPGGDPWYRRVFSSPARAALVIAATVLLFAGATLGGLQLAGNNDAAKNAGDPAPGDPAGGGAPATKPANRQPAVDPASVTVAVLNGTTVQGAAQGVADTVEGEGFNIGLVSNFTDQTRAESVVLFARGAEREAQDVQRRLKVGQREPIDPDIQALAGDASVVLLVGADKAQQ